MKKKKKKQNKTNKNNTANTNSFVYLKMLCFHLFFSIIAILGNSFTMPDDAHMWERHPAHKQPFFLVEKEESRFLAV